MRSERVVCLKEMSSRGAKYTLKPSVSTLNLSANMAKLSKTRVRLTLDETTVSRLSIESDFLSKICDKPISSGAVVDAILDKMTPANWIVLRASLKQLDFGQAVDEV